jgi:hypothetical protein
MPAANPHVAPHSQRERANSRRLQGWHAHHPLNRRPPNETPWMKLRFPSLPWKATLSSQPSRHPIRKNFRARRLSRGTAHDSCPRFPLPHPVRRPRTRSRPSKSSSFRSTLRTPRSRRLNRESRCPRHPRERGAVGRLRPARSTPAATLSSTAAQSWKGRRWCALRIRSILRMTERFCLAGGLAVTLSRRSCAQKSPCRILSLSLTM